MKCHFRANNENFCKQCKSLVVAFGAMMRAVCEHKSETFVRDSTLQMTWLNCY